LADDPSSASRGAAPGQGEPPAPGPRTAFLFGFIHLTVFILVFALGASLVEATSALLVNEGVAALVAPLLALYVALARWAPTEPTLAAVGLVRLPGGTWRALRVLTFAIVLGAALALLASEISARVLELLPMPPLDGGGGVGGGGDVGDSMYVGTEAVLVFCWAVLAPMAEEMLYRGFLQPRVRVGTYAAGNWRAALLVAGVFALVQTNPRAIPAAFLLGLGLALAARSGASTWASIATHVTFQALPLVLLYVLDVKLPGYSGSSSDALYLPFEVTAAAAGVTAAAAYALWRLRIPGARDNTRLG
jgi:membrane protease YdiL (CAAX protease family)